MNWTENSKLLFEEEKRYEIPSLNKDVPSRLIDELNHLYPGYELVYRADCKAWVLYKLKHRGGCSADDTLFKQFVLPDEPDMWLISLMQQLDRGNVTFKEWNANRKKIEEFQESRRHRAKVTIQRDMSRDIDAYVRRGKETLHINRG